MVNHEGSAVYDNVVALVQSRCVLGERALFSEEHVDEEGTRLCVTLLVVAGLHRDRQANAILVGSGANDVALEARILESESALLGISAIVVAKGHVYFLPLSLLQ